MAKEFPDLMTAINPRSKILNSKQKRQKENKSKQIIIELLKISIKEKIVKAEKKDRCRGTKVKIVRFLIRNYKLKQSHIMEFFTAIKRSKEYLYTSTEILSKKQGGEKYVCYPSFEGEDKIICLY